MDDLKKVAATQEKYYGDLLKTHGAGVDAVASAKQIYKDLRYKKLSKVFQGDNDFTLHDVGFGVGHYYEYVKQTQPDLQFTYSGSEVTKGFVEHCQKAYLGMDFFYRDLAAQAFPERYDYLIFGGTFYHKVDSADDAFELFYKSILTNAFQMSNKGIAFNFITDFVDYKYPDLYYARIADVTDFVVKNLSRYFTVDHCYPLYEFTVTVHTEQHIATLYPQDEFQKYYANNKK
jgi:hypothetical protein